MTIDNKIDDKTRRDATMAISRAKIGMLEAHPFYACILTKLKFELVEDLPHGAPTATDGRSVFIRPQPVTITLPNGRVVTSPGYLQLTKAEQLTALAHEQLHCLDGHLWRRGQRDPLIANIAQDIYIYHVLCSDKFVTLRQNEQALVKALTQLAGGKFTLQDFAGQFWEQIYQTLAPLNPRSKTSADGGSGNQGDAIDGLDGECHCYKPAPTQGSRSDSDRVDANQWKQWIREAGTYARIAGSQPGAWCAWVEAATPRVPFETRFAEYLKRGLGGDQQYESFNRRYLSRGEYMPSEAVEQMCETVGLTDTSGSIPDEDIAYAIGVFRNWRSLHPCKFHLIEFDAAVHQHHSYDEFEEIPSKFNVKGRGGTRFDTPFLYLTEKQIEPGLIIMITDGFNYGDFAPAPAAHVLWLLAGEYNKEFKPPYGEVCTVDREQM